VGGVHVILLMKRKYNQKNANFLIPSFKKDKSKEYFSLLIN